MIRIIACLSTAITIIALSLATAGAQNQAQFNERLSAVVEVVSDVTDPGFAKDIRFFANSDYDEFFPQIPPDFAAEFGPEIPGKALESTPEAIAFASAYFPMNKGMKLKYEYSSSEFDDTKIVVIEIVEVSARDEEVYARVRMTPNLGGRTAVSFYTITRNPTGVFSGETIITGPRKELNSSVSASAKEAVAQGASRLFLQFAPLVLRYVLTGNRPAGNDGSVPRC